MSSNDGLPAQSGALIRVTFIQLEERAKERPEGYIQDVVRHALKSDETGIWLEPSVWMELMAKYDPKGYGTRLYQVVHPIALKIDQITGTHLANCLGCAERMEILNGEIRKPSAVPLPPSVDSHAATH